MWAIFSISIVLTSFGSVWYHLNPDNNTLVWDRIPITTAFLAFFLLVAKDYLDEGWIDFIQWPGLIAGPATVLMWWNSERNGAGDMRPYALMQVLPLVLTVAIISMRRSRVGVAQNIAVAIGFYILSKIFEFNDISIYSTNGLISGHTVKHLLAGVSCFVLFNSKLAELEMAHDLTLKVD
jgi:hypothetical protein